jgi:small subunit ribosomal protein S21
MKKYHNGPVIQGAKVYVKNDDVNGALRKLKKILEGADRQKELSKREYFEKPSITRKRNKAAAKKRSQKAERQRQSTGVANKITGVKWMKSKRKRRRILDAETALTSYKRGK